MSGALAENALDHEPGTTIDPIGLSNFLEGVAIPVAPNMVNSRRCNRHFRSDDRDAQAA